MGEITHLIALVHSRLSRRRSRRAAHAIRPTRLPEQGDRYKYRFSSGTGMPRVASLAALSLDESLRFKGWDCGCLALSDSLRPRRREAGDSVEGASRTEP